MHISNNLREEFNYAFEGDKPDWIGNLGTTEQVQKYLGNFHNCTDIVPSYVRSEAADWLWQQSNLCDNMIKELKCCCTYAQLTRRLRLVLSSMLK